MVIVVVGYEIFHRIVREEGLEFAVELRGEGFVVAEYQGRSLEPFYDVGHSERLAGAGDSKKSNVTDSRVKGGAQLLDCLRLVSGRAVV